MKKILAISIIAMTAVTAANAEIASKAYVDQNIGTISTYGNATNVAAAIANAIAGVSETAGTALQTVTANAGDGVVTNIAADGTAVTMTKAKVTGSDIADNANIAKTQLATDVQTSLGKADTAQQPATTLAGYGITDAYTKAEIGTPTAGKTIVEMIADADYDDTALAARVSANETAIEGLGDLATKSAVAEADLESTLATKINGKADAATTIAGYGITDAYTKTETDTAISSAITAEGLGTMAKETAANYTKTADLDSSTTATSGQVVTAISMENGQLSQTTADPLSVTSYSNVAGNDANGQYVLTKYVNGNTTTFKWELISRTGNETVSQ